MGRKLSERFEALAWEQMDLLYTRALDLTSNMAKAEVLVQETVSRAFEQFARGYDLKGQWLHILRQTFAEMQA